MALAPVSSNTSASQASFGLDFQSLLKIIMTQLTYQDPLKPVDNFEFVSQLAQFSQLYQSQSLNDQITSLLSAQSASQATSLLGRTIDVSSGQATSSGVVQSISFTGSSPTITMKTADGTIVSDVSMSNITQVR